MKKQSKIWLYLTIILLVIILFIFLNQSTRHKVKDFYYSLTKEAAIKVEKDISYTLDTLRSKGPLTTQILEKKYYTVGYAESARQAEWTDYMLNRKMVEMAGIMRKEKKVKRPKKFHEDPSITGIAPRLSDYSNSGYSRGHLVPASDMAFSQESINDTFYLSNMSPQKQELNGGIWNNLEDKVRNWAISKENLYIVGAGILTENIGYIGKNKILVPKYFYKIILSLNENGDREVIAFIIPHEKEKDKDLEDYVVTVNEIEAKTKIDFFSKIDAKIKLILKSTKNSNSWKF